jgi:hypothetical protein
MLSFGMPEHDHTDSDPDPDLSTSLDPTHMRPDRGFDLDLTSLSARSSYREGWVDWRAGHCLGGTSVSTDTGVGQ